MSDDLVRISALLSKDRYESKDWKQADLVGRIEWLILMLEAKGEEVDMWVSLANEGSTPSKTHAEQLQQALALPEIKALVDALKQGLVMGNEICKALPPLNNDPFFNSANAALAAVGVKP